MKGYFISTSALICLLMLLLYFPAKDVLTNDVCIKKPVPQGEQNKIALSVTASENAVVKKNIPVNQAKGLECVQTYKRPNIFLMMDKSQTAFMCSNIFPTKIKNREGL